MLGKVVTGKMDSSVAFWENNLPSKDEMMQSIKEFYDPRDLASIPKHNTNEIANFEDLWECYEADFGFRCM
ncbi:hypothetical protein SLE2022_263860 [Rubroshorea leprosula]